MNKPLNPWKLPEFRAGQNITCRVERQERDGYAVTISKDNLPGFLPTEESLKIGEEILAQFVCVSNNRILLTTRFSSVTGNKREFEYVDWEQQVSQLGSSVDSPANAESTKPLTEEEAAFRVWAKQLSPKRMQLRRATDLILPPLNEADVETFTTAEHDLEWLITDLEGGMRSGCIKASCESVLSRSAMLLYRGRCVGCIYSSKSNPECPPQEEALQHTIADMKHPDTKIKLYDLPESLVLASSALFLGYPVEHQIEPVPRDCFDYTLEWLDSKKYTACLTIGLTNRIGHCFVYIYRGLYVGSFYVEDQTFNQNRDFVYSIIAEDPKATINVQILPNEMTSAAVRFGYSLSIATKQTTF